MSSVAKIIEITSTSTKSFDDAVKTGVERAAQTIDNIKGAWVSDQQVVVDGGKIIIDAAADDLRGTAVTLVGGHGAVERFAEGRNVLGWESIGGISSVTMTGLTEGEKADAVAAGLEVAPVSLQQLIVSRTRSNQEAHS